MKNRNTKRILRSVLFMALFVALIGGNKNYAQASASASITATTLVTGEEELTKESACLGDMITNGSDSGKTSVVAITTECGGLLSVYYKGTNQTDIILKLYSDEACINEIGFSGVKASADLVAADSMVVPKAGTYYLKLFSNETVDISFLVAADIVSSEDATLTSGQVRATVIVDNSDENYYKFTLKKSGIIRVNTTYYSGNECNADVDIYKSVDGKKKLVTEGDASVEGKVYGLVKGTYYIKVSNAESGFYKIKYKYTSLANKSGSKKSKAKAVAFEKVMEGLILASDKPSKEHWYKFTNSKSRKISLTFSGEVTGGVSLEFFSADGRRFGSWNISEYSPIDAASPYVGSYSQRTLPKGTYYMKVTKDSGNTSGYYSIYFE